MFAPFLAYVLNCIVILASGWWLQVIQWHQGGMPTSHLKIQCSRDCASLVGMELCINWFDMMRGFFSVYIVLAFVEFIFYSRCVVWTTIIM